MSYNVVFEHTDQNSLFFGTRTWTDYNNKKYFEKNYQPTEVETVIAEGVTQEEAISLTSLTPEVCRIAAAIEEAFEHSFSAQLFEYQIFSAIAAISHDRSLILKNGLVREPAGRITDFILKYIDRLTEGEDLKKKLLKSLIGHTNHYGQVKLSGIDLEFKILPLLV